MAYTEDAFKDSGNFERCDFNYIAGIIPDVDFKPVDSPSSKADKEGTLAAAPYQTYPSRWYVLVLYAVLGLCQNMIYSTLSPIANFAQPALGLTQTDIALLANWYNIMFVVGVFPYMWLIQVKGLRMPVTSGAVFMCIGAFVRCLNTDGANQTFDTAMIHLGQVINGLAASVLWFACTKLSAVWFPPSERAVSTSIGLVTGGLGVAVSFVVGPYTVQGLGEKWADNGNTQEQNWAIAIRFLFYGEAIVSAILCTLTLIYFPSEPPTPPCYSASSERFEFLKGLWQFAQSKDGWLIFILYSVTGAVLGGWTQFLAITVKDVIDDIQAGWLGCIITVASFASGPITSLTARYWIHGRVKLVSSLLLFVGAGLTAVFLVAFVQQKLTAALCWGTLVTGAFFITACQPLWWELACESAYPVPEQIVAGIFALGSTIIAIIFFGLYSVQSIGTAWANWCLALGECICVPIIFFYSGAKKRMAEDQQAEERRQAAGINQGEYGKLQEN